jgi:hypothetical protein
MAGVNSMEFESPWPTCRTTSTAGLCRQQLVTASVLLLQLLLIATSLL